VTGIIGSKHGMFKSTHSAWGAGRARTEVRELERRRVMASEVVEGLNHILVVST
jgi:hypothetical protein